ncbi:type IV toxin-antitoxin system AbiEi family antitoxin domain-containing protein [Motilibacter peucedani]|nr:type IV toxin-antitoxin system AbiEi family antitoxin domain-containing protein [Motilibacter peucedani]
MTPGLLALATAQGGVFSAADAGVHGFPPDEVARLVAEGRWVRLRHGVYSLPDEVDPTGAHRLAVRAAQLCVAHAVASHSSAALLLGMVLLEPPSTVTLTAARADHRKRPGLHVLRAPLPDEHVRADGHGVPVTSGARTAIDLARSLPLHAAVVAMDSALRLRLATPEALDEALQAVRGWRGAPQAVRAVRLADGRSESPGETLARLVMAELGLPTPVPQGVVRGASGRPYRGDLVLEEHHVVVEFDGWSKYAGDGSTSAAEVLRAEKRREDDLRAAGYEFVRLEWRDLHDPGRLEHVVRAALERSARRHGR